jgi:signal peptidase
MDTQVGEVVVYNVRGKDIPIVHRVVRRFGGGSVPFRRHPNECKWYTDME